MEKMISRSVAALVLVSLLPFFAFARQSVMVFLQNMVRLCRLRRSLRPTRTTQTGWSRRPLAFGTFGRPIGRTTRQSSCTHPVMGEGHGLIVLYPVFPIHGLPATHGLPGSVKMMLSSLGLQVRFLQNGASRR